MIQFQTKNYAMIAIWFPHNSLLEKKVKHIWNFELDLARSLKYTVHNRLKCDESRKKHASVIVTTFGVRDTNWDHWKQC